MCLPACLFQQDITGNKEIFLRINIFVRRDTNGKDRTSAVIVFIFNRTFMHLYQFITQMQTNSDTITGKTTLHKSLEQLILLLFWNTNTCIRYLNLQCLLHFIYRNRKYNRTVRRSIFKSVRQQVISHFIQITFIKKHLVRRYRRNKTEIHILLLRYITETQEDFIKESNDIRFFQRECQLIILHLAELQ